MTKKQKISEGLLQIVKEENPKAKGIKISQMNEITGGWETELYSFVLEYKIDKQKIKKKLVVRMYPSSAASNKLATEHFIYKTLERMNYPVPKIHYASNEIKFLAKPFIVMDYITGGTLDERSKTNPEKTLETFCKLFVDLHKLEWKPFISDIDSDEISILSIDSYLDKLERRIIKNKFDELKPIIEWLNEKRKSIQATKLSLCHFDFHPFNILMNENEEPFVIDWPSANVSDYRFDLGWTLVLYRAYSNQEIRDALFNKYQKVAQKEIEQIDYFEVTGILRRLSDILIIFKARGEEIGLQSDVTDMIKDTIFHVENLNNYLEELTGFRIAKIDELIKEAKK